MMMKKGVGGKVKTVTTGVKGSSIEVGDDASIEKIDGKRVTVKVGKSSISTEFEDEDEVEVVQMMHGKKLAAYMIERVSHE
jgi:hypothetical protein